ncbi:MAG: UDP-3-O-(3-hydroxymyristoyl)glucosamine N-acyltransferase [Janthinobacterium lividum]
MIDSRFYKSSGALTLQELAEVSKSQLYQPKHYTSQQTFKSVSDLEQATSSDICLFHNKKYKEAFQKTKAGVCFVSPKDIEDAPSHTALLISDVPQRSFALALIALYPMSEGHMSPMTESAIHPTAEIGFDTILEYGVTIKENAKIGHNCRIGSHTSIGAGVVIGDNAWIGQNVTISHALIGQNVTLYPGVRVGQAGFGFAMDEKGFVTIPQLGRVLIEDYVEIGANSTIDRGSLRDTIIGRGSRLDNLVMIAHNVVLGKGCVLVAQVGIAGSTILGDHVVIAGQAGLIGHLKIGDRAQIGAQSGVMRDIAPGDVVLGSPALPVKEYMRKTATLNRLSKANSKQKEIKRAQ